MFVRVTYSVLSWSSFLQTFSDCNRVVWLLTAVDFSVSVVQKDNLETEQPEARHILIFPLVLVVPISGLADVAVEEATNELGVDFEIGRGAVKLAFSGATGSLKRITNEEAQVGFCCETAGAPTNLSKAPRLMGS